MLTQIGKTMWPAYASRGKTQLVSIYHIKNIIRGSILLIISYFVLTSNLFYPPAELQNELKNFLHDVSIKRSLQGLEIAQVNEEHSAIVNDRGPKEQRLPSAIIIGVNQCGTGALRDILSMHPNIVAAKDEVGYFAGNEQLFKNGVEGYRRMMPYSYEDQITIEKSPQYFRSRLAPSRIKFFNSNTKLLLIVREPVQRLLSGYAQNKANGRPPFEPFEDSVIFNGKVMETEIVKDSIYWTHYKHYLEVFPREQILIVDGDAMIKDPLPVIEKVEDFLDVGRNITEENLYFNVTKGFWCMNSDVISGCLGNGEDYNHEKVRLEVITKLREFYAPHNQRFYKLSGINFHWAEF